jgi:hypothetical protein
MRADGDNAARPAAGIAFLERGGEMGRRMRAFDWAATPLGPAQAWPQSLRTVVRILLDSRCAMWMLWGPELTFFCNDAYLPTVGIRSDWVLGARSDKVWAEAWPDVGPRIAHVLATGEATWNPGLMLLLERSGYPEETYHAFSYSPVYDDGGSIGGMLCVVTEDTERRISERRIALLGAIGADLALANCEADVFAGAARHLGGLHDLPCALVFMHQEGALKCTLRAGFDDAHRLAGDRNEDAHAMARQPIEDARWPVDQVLASGVEQTIELDARFGDLPRGPRPDPPRTALLLPIQQQGRAQPAGVFVARLNRPRNGGQLAAARLGRRSTRARGFRQPRLPGILRPAAAAPRTRGLARVPAPRGRRWLHRRSARRTRCAASVQRDGPRASQRRRMAPDPVDRRTALLGRR